MESSKSAEEPETSKECKVASVTAKEPVPSSNYDTKSSGVDKLKPSNVDDIESSVTEVSKPSDVGDKESSVVGELKPCNISAVEFSVVEESLVMEELKSSNVGDMGSSVVEERKSSDVRDMKFSAVEELKSSSYVGYMESSVVEEFKSSNVGDMESSVAEELNSENVGDLESSVAEDLKSSNEGDMEYPNREEEEPLHEQDMSSSSSEGPEPTFLKSIPYEKGNCCVLLWYVENFSMVANYEDELKSPAFIVNIKSGISWFLKLHFKMKNEPSYIGVSFRPADTLESTIKLACKINIVQIQQNIYAGDDCSTKEIITFENELFFPRLVRKDFIALNKFKFLENDTLLIKCELNVETYEEDPKFFANSIHHGQFRDRKLICIILDHLYTSRAYADSTWRLANGQEERVHKPFLAARSSNLERMIRGRRITGQGSEREFSSDLVTPEQAFYLLAYTYSGNPYNVVCVPLGFGELVHACGLELLKHYTQPNVMAFRTRMRVQKMTLSIKIKNVSKQLNPQKKFIVKFFCVGSGDAYSSKWSLFMDLKRDKHMLFRLVKISSPPKPFNVEFRTYVLNIYNRYVSLDAQTLSSETIGHSYSFIVQTRHVLGNKAFFMPNDHLNLKIFMQITYNVLQESREQFETRFYSKIALIDENEPPDFVRLMKNLLEMYGRRIHSDMRVITVGNDLHTHKLMLKIHSRHFNNLIRENPVLDYVPLQQLKYSNAQKLILFMYSGILHQVDLDDIEELLRNADNYEFNYLKREILRFCRRNLNESTQRKLLEIAINCKETELEAEIRRRFPSESDRAHDPENGPASSTQSQNLVEDAGHSLRSSDQEISFALDSSREDSTSSLAVSLPYLDQNQTESLEPRAESKKLVVSSEIVEEKDSKSESSLENKDLEAISQSSGEGAALEETNRTVMKNKDPKATSSTKTKDLYVYPHHCGDKRILVETPRTTMESKYPKIITSMHSEDHEASHRSAGESQTSVVAPLVVMQTQDSKVTPRIMNADSEASSSSSEEDQSLVVSPQAVVENKDPETESIKNKDSNVNPGLNA